MKQVIIFGTGGFAEIVHYYLTHDSEYEVVAFTAHKKYVQEDLFCNLPVVPFEEINSHFSPDDHYMFVAMGYKQMNKIREKICEESKQKGYSLISYVNSKATTWDDLSTGENCFIFENNVIQPFVKIGNNVILWSGNHIGHHSIISDHCFISSHVVISGYVKIKHNCFLGVNATIRDGVTIAEECLIGAGSYIDKDTQPRQIFVPPQSTPLDLTTDKLTHL